MYKWLAECVRPAYIPPRHAVVRDATCVGKGGGGGQGKGGRGGGREKWGSCYAETLYNGDRALSKNHSRIRKSGHFSIDGAVAAAIVGEYHQ